jgi:hypothetical protein
MIRVPIAMPATAPELIPLPPLLRVASATVPMEARVGVVVSDVEELGVGSWVCVVVVGDGFCDCDDVWPLGG